jgi:hypothetical protein
VLLLTIICQRESINLTMNLKETLASNLEETKVKQTAVCENFHVCRKQRQL